MTSSYFFGWQWIELLSKVYFDTIAALKEPPQYKPNYHFTPLLYTFAPRLMKRRAAMATSRFTMLPISPR